MATCLCLSFSHTVTNNPQVSTQNASLPKRTFHALLCFIEMDVSLLFSRVVSFFLSCFVFL